MELKFNEATTVRPNHLERCLCYDKFLKGHRCYVYDDISKYWCTQATTEHDPDGENHIVDYADYQVTEWASLQQEQPEKSQKSCNDCPHCVDRKDQFGWHFKGCFGGPYNGKFIAEIDECPLQQESIEKDEKMEALIACDIMEATVKRVNIDKRDKDKEEEAMLEKINYLRNLGLKGE